MHELSLCESLIELVEDERLRRGFTKVRAMRVAVGALGHVDPDAMRFCFDAVTSGTIAQGARLDIETVPGVGYCLDCGQTVTLTDRFAACPGCGHFNVRMTGGDELRLKELEVE
ncbi:hydrogenase maturation nickel metallochaperone HypA [Burkholderia multivorans]|uniref:hydrogenase maturation nickel metallochaperone HypA n=1 Tax=Burkholderia multivorans TaxID=87883 RepID=UPI000CFF9539|nr:hydrogenase maturation nickel metallochaperone HypA [Burkholderia multivorans]PRH18942.1 hydrogenase maturation nickel metallochaperone HypA [Burkholderia multivorans]